MRGMAVNHPMPKRSAESGCPTCRAVGLANDLGLCKSCGADLATHFDEREHSFRHTQVLPIPGLAGALRVAPAKALTFPQLLYYGQPLVREKGVFRVETEGRPILVRLKRGFVDPYPTVLVDGVKLPYGDPLPWYATLLAFLPTIFMVGAGCLGIALGAISTGYCLKALRTGKTRFARFGVPLIINGVTIPLGGALLIMKVLAFAPPDIGTETQAVVSTNGLARMNIPTVWVSMPDLADGADLAYGSEALDEYMIVFAEPLNDLGGEMTLSDYAELTLPALDGAELGELAPLTIAGRDALQRDVTGSSSGTRVTWMHTVVDMGTHYYQVCIWTGRTDFYRRREAYAGITSSLSTATLSAAAELVARGDAFPLTAMRRANPSTHHTTVERTPIPEPPGGLFEVVRYRAPLGENAAYVTPVSPGERKPAIVWLAGGFTWGLWEGAWEPADRANDQSARAFRDAGMVMMLPALRGSHDSAGERECYHGEVDDVLAAVEYLKTRPDVDPERIFLGGHSSGATLALLAAASTDAFRGVVAFGPAPDPRWYGDRSCLSPELDETQLALRAPVNFVRYIRAPTYVIEGGDSGSLDVVQRHAGSAPLHSFMVPNANHFDVLAPGTEAAAAWMTSDDPQAAITLEAITSRMGPTAATP